MIRKSRQTGIELSPENIQGIGGVDLAREGELSTDSSDSELKVHLDSATRTVVTEDQVQVLTNKTIDADLNTISDLELDNLKTGVLNVSTTLTGASDLQVASALAVKTYVDDKAAAQNEASEITVVPAGTIAATNVQAALEELDGDIQAHINDTVDAHDASAISNFPTGNLAATDVQSALNELQGDADTNASAISSHLSDTTDAHDASAISVAATGTLLATDVQAALIELESEIVAASGSAGTVQTNLTNHINDTVDAHDASAISNTPSGNLAATDIQAAVNELQGDIDTNASNLTSHLNDNTDAHDASAISSVASGNLAATDVQTALNELQSDIDLRALTTNGSIITPARLDVKQDTKGNLTTYALTATNGQLVFATDTKEYLSVIDGLLEAVGGGGSGIASVDILSAEIADAAALTDFTQTGLEILDTPIVLHGVKSFRLQHATSIKSFKKIIAVDRKFRGKNNTISLDVVSTATNANLNIIFRDETNSVNLGTSQAIATNSQAITATTANASASMNGMTNSVFNTLKVGMIVTGSAIPVGTTIIALNSATATATLSQNATGVSTGIRTSDLVAKKSFSVDIPANCSSFSWTISSVVEAATESYIDDVVVQLTSAALMSTSVTVPRTVATKSYTPVFTGFGTPTNVEFEYDEDGEYYNIRGKFTAGTTTAVEARISLPNGATSGNTTLIPSISAVGSFFRGAATQNTMTVLIEPSVEYITLSSNQASTNPLLKANGNGVLVTGETGEFFCRVPIANAAATTSVTIPLTTSQLVQTPDSMIRLDTANGYGSTNTVIRRFSNVRENIGSSIKYLDSATLGASFEILESGTYSVNFTDNNNGQNYIAITKNSTELTTGANSLTNHTSRLAYSTVTAASLDNQVSWTGYLNAQDIIRPHGAGVANGASPDRASFTISKQGSLKQLNVSSDSKITIPTHQLRFEGASSRGSVATAIVKFDTQAITQGDAWDVVSTVADGTVVTMKKAGKLNIDATVHVGSSSYAITLNETNLASYTVTSGISLSVNNTTGGYQSLSKSIDVKVGDKIRVAAAVNPTLMAANSFSLSLTENSIPANFSNVLPQWSQSDSAIEVSGANGFGTSPNYVRRFSNNPINLGTAITYTDDATLGGLFKINEDGLYTASFVDSGNIVIDVAIRVNNISRSVSTTAGTNYRSCATFNGYLYKGDVVTMYRTDNNSGSSLSDTRAMISKVGKPNLSSVDVTSFVNMKTTDTEAIEALTSTSTFGSTNTGVPVLNITKNTNLGVIRVDSSAANGTSFVALKDCRIALNAVAVGGTGATAQVTRNSTNLVASGGGTGVIASGVVQSQSSGGDLTISFNGLVFAGDIIRLQRNSIAGLVSFGTVTITATADNNAIASPTQQVSSDTMSFAFKATAIDPATDAIGTFNTYTYAAGGNAATISASAPTQTANSMNINGVQVFTAPFTATTTSAQPARVDVFIGMGLKSKQVDGYGALAKTLPIFTDSVVGSTVRQGLNTVYNEKTGILSLDARFSTGNVTAAEFKGAHSTTDTSYSSGYFVFNASRSPSLVSLPNLKQRIAYLSDVKASGTAGGTLTTATFVTRVLNTLEDPTGLVTSLSANQFILPAGEYDIDGYSTTYGGVNGSKNRIRNITLATDAIIGSSGFSTGNNNFQLPIKGRIQINNTTTFELQHRVGTSVGTVDAGNSANAGVNEVYSQIKITRIK